MGSNLSDHKQRKKETNKKGLNSREQKQKDGLGWEVQIHEGNSKYSYDEH